MIIAFPPCTYLTNAANRCYSMRVTPAEKVARRLMKQEEAIMFFLRFVMANCERIAIENPKGKMNSLFRKPDQIIEPYFFAEKTSDEDYVCKKTCLWLKGLPPLVRLSSLPRPKPFRGTRAQSTTGKIKANTWTECVKGPNRSKTRSKTFPGVAKAMAEQWGSGIINTKEDYQLSLF